MLRDQANMLVNAGHEVKVLTGNGLDTGEGYEFVLVPELAPDFELNKSVRTVLERGQVGPEFQPVPLGACGGARGGTAQAWTSPSSTISSPCITTWRCTHALHDLAPRHKMVAWTHDLTATQFRFRAAQSDAAAVEPDADELARTSPTWPRPICGRPKSRPSSSPQSSPGSFPNMVDPVRLFGVTPEMRTALLALGNSVARFCFPAAGARHGAQEHRFRHRSREEAPRTGSQSAAAHHRREGARQHRRCGPRSLRRVPAPIAAGRITRPRHFLSDYFRVQDDTLRDLYLLSDCLLFPSRQEGFGLPVLEAALHRMPVWCRDIPAFRALDGSGSFLLDDIGKLPEAVNWLEAQSPFRQQRRCRRLFDPSIVYSNHYEPFLNSLAPPKTS